MSRERTATPTQADEVEALRARVAMLEAQVAETEAWANRAVAEAQEKTYWLDRWHLDLNAMMRRRSADRARAAARGLRPLVRALRKLSQRFRT
jgi:hypothetical protein